MLSRRALALALVALPVTFNAFAAEKVGYSPAAFDAAQKAGKPILVEIHAPWCPTCKAQTPILTKLEAEPQYAGLKVFHVDFDSQKEAVRRFGARMQSTLVVFKGEAETGRSVGDTNADSIAALLSKTL
jgi:thiol-disulfide isomerase/thioredoxin